jgi:hypothetical protein
VPWPPRERGQLPDPSEALRRAGARVRACGSAALVITTSSGCTAAWARLRGSHPWETGHGLRRTEVLEALAEVARLDSPLLVDSGLFRPRETGSTQLLA